MSNGKQKRFSPPAVGGISLLAAFAVLCLTIFALLSLTTVRADGRLSDTSAQAVADYYAADYAAQTILAQLRAGQIPEGVTVWEDRYTYTCPISATQNLQVEIKLNETDYAIVRWQAVPAGTWEADDSLELWDGTVF